MNLKNNKRAPESAVAKKPGSSLANPCAISIPILGPKKRLCIGAEAKLN